MSRLHVCVDLMIFPFGSVMAIGLVAGLMFTAGAPAIRKWLVAPESEIAHLTVLVSRSRSKIVFACGSPRNFLVWMICSHACCLVSACVDKLFAAGRVDGMTVG